MISVATWQYHGITLPIYMTRSQWELRTKNKQCVLVKRHGQLVAVALYKIDARMSERKIDIDNCFWQDIEARIKLFSFFAKHRDQIRYVYLEVPFGTNFHQWFGDVMDSHEIKMTMPPYMVRVMDIEQAIALLPADQMGKVTLALTDANCEWNNGIFTLQSDHNKLKINRSSEDQLNVSGADIKISIEGISALVYGTCSIAEIEHRQWLVYLKQDFVTEIRSLLESWFPVLPIYNTFRF